MQARTVASVIGAVTALTSIVLFWSCQQPTRGHEPAQSAKTPGQSQIEATNDKVTPSASAPVTTHPPSAPSASLSAPRPSTYDCTPECTGSTTCQLTAKGTQCVTCAPGSLATCKDDRYVVQCDDKGNLQTKTDCASLNKYCDRGRCAAFECTPNQDHCYNGDIYECSANGLSRTLKKACVEVDSEGTMDTPNGLCQKINGKPQCHAKCLLPDHTIVALRDCDKCSWDNVPFCSEESEERGCVDWICLPGGEYTGGAVSIGCVRSTEGLVVPDSEKPGKCEGTGDVGKRVINYEVCEKGKSRAKSRTVPCKMTK